MKANKVISEKLTEQSKEQISESIAKAMSATLIGIKDMVLTKNQFEPIYSSG